MLYLVVLDLYKEVTFKYMPISLQIHKLHAYIDVDLLVKNWFLNIYRKICTVLCALSFMLFLKSRVSQRFFVSFISKFIEYHPNELNSVLTLSFILRKIKIT